MGGPFDPPPLDVRGLNDMMMCRLILTDVDEINLNNFIEDEGVLIQDLN